MLVTFFSDFDKNNNLRHIFLMYCIRI